MSNKYPGKKGNICILKRGFFRVIKDNSKFSRI